MEKLAPEAEEAQEDRFVEFAAHARSCDSR